MIENAAGGTDWGTIDSLTSSLAHGQSEISAYSVPLGKKVFVKNVFVWVDAARASDVLFMQRENILDAADRIIPTIIPNPLMRHIACIIMYSYFC